MKYSIQKISQIIDAQILVLSNAPTNIEYLALDSRRLSFPNESIFFALVGVRNDAHLYLSQAYQAGVRNFVISKNIDFQYFPQANFLKVADTLRALQQLAAFHRAQFEHLQVIGITGSNGKTVVKEWLAQLLEAQFQLVKSPKSYNSQTGVPLSLWQIEPQHQMAFIEAGISQINEMQALANMIKPNIGIFTMIGAAHDEGFKNIEEKIEEKIKLFQSCEYIVYNADEIRIATILAKTFPEKKRIAWTKNNSIDENVFLKIIDIQLFKNFSILKATTTEGGGAAQIFEFQIPFTDPASVANACTCVTLLLKNHFSIDFIVQKMPLLKPVEMRLELKAGINRSLVINDAYNSDLTSLAVALDFATQQGADLKRTLILSDILQSGQLETSLYQKIANLIVEKNITRFIGIGKHIQQTKHFLPPSVSASFWDDTNIFLQQIKNSDFGQEVIVIKGARDFAFERVAARLSQKAHKTILEINLSALTHNFQLFKNIISEGYKKNIKLMAMVKAAAYGNGAAETARLLQFHKADYLAVAYADEGIALREAGVKLPIMVLNSEASSFDALLRFDLEPEVYSISILRDFANFAKSRPAKIHIKLDTGMRRLGFEMLDLEEVINILKENLNLKIASIFTHLAASENPLHDAFTRLQVEKYEAMYKKIIDMLGLTEGVIRPLRHVLNSSGIVRFPEFRFDMVRLGIGLYGIDGSEVVQSQLRVVQTLRATISQIKHLNAGETVGYGRRGVMVRPSRIATISIGYADGLPRLAGLGRFSVWLHEQCAQIVGNVCMDMTMIDVTDIEAASEGDEVEIFGQNQPIQFLAEALGTIPYEIFTNIAERVKRVYFVE